MHIIPGLPHPTYKSISPGDMTPILMNCPIHRYFVGFASNLHDLGNDHMENYHIFVIKACTCNEKYISLFCLDLLGCDLSWSCVTAADIKVSGFVLLCPLDERPESNYGILT